LRKHYTNVRNLRYLRELVRREENGEVCTAEEIALTLQPITAKSVQNAMRVLKTHGLVEIHKGKIKKKKTQTFSPTRLGYHVLNMYPSSNEEE
jgi:Mn-dependent DtxR family transcriptional regulator